MKRYIVLILLGSVALFGCDKKEQADKIPTEQQDLLGQPADTISMDADLPNAMETTQGLDVLQTNSPAVAVDSAAEKPSTEPTVKNIQLALKNASLYTGKIDGSPGPKTKKAIEEFQAQNELKVDGKVGPKTWAKLQPYLSQQVTSSPAPKKK